MGNSNGNFPISLSLEVIAGRHLSRKEQNKGICSPMVEIEIAGFASDAMTQRTSTISKNLYGKWPELCSGHIFMGLSRSTKSEWNIFFTK